MTPSELGRELMKLGTAGDRVKVLDVDHSATTFKLPQIEARVRVGVYYLRPPASVTAQEMKEVFDESEGLAFRYKVTSGIGTDHMELLTPDEYARQYFSGSAKLIHIEGARKAAREQLEEMFDAMKVTFDPLCFPHLDDVVISGFKQGNDEFSTQVTLLAYDDDFRSMSRIERDLAKNLSEGNLHREIIVGRHLVRDTKPEFILSTTAKATAKGREFLNDLATHMVLRDGGLQTQAIRVGVSKPIDQKSEAQVYKSLVQAFPKTHPVVEQPAEIVSRAAVQFQETLSQMSAFKKLEIKKVPGGIQVEYPKNLFGGRRFEERDLRELKAVHAAILGSPGLHEGWSAHHLYDKNERVLKIRFATSDDNLERPWSNLGEA
jgi:hypothetical protein